MSGCSLRPWQSGDEPQLATLWKTAFGDSDGYIASFFSKYLQEGNCIVAAEDGKILSAMYLIPGQTIYPFRKETLDAGYAYALATLPAYRGQGIGSAVYKAVTEKILETADMACVLPAEAPLYPFYEKAAGAKAVSWAKEAHYTREELKALPAGMAAMIPALEYARAREKLLGGMPHVIFPDSLFELMEESDVYFYVLEDGAAAAQIVGDTCLVMELLDPETDCMKSIASLARWCSAKEYIIRTPLFYDGPGEPRPYMLGVMKEAPNYPMPTDLWWGFGLE